MTKRIEGRSGFTLIELLIVVVIIGILAAIAIPKFTKARQKSFVSMVQSDLRNLSLAQERFHMDSLTYSLNLADVGIEESSGVTITINEATNVGWSATGTHVGDPTLQCGVFVGAAAAAGGAPATVPEVIACTN